MGFTVTPLAQKARTKTLIADSDLNLGNYDLIATDVRGDTAEFGEFVGGVGNFSNVLSSGNLDIEGTGNIKGLTTFQNAVQVNGSLHVEGSINNVNIADNGEITTAQGVNGADFNGAKITSTKFNGATINTSGDYSGRKGTFSGAVTGTSFNGVPIKQSGNITVTTSNTILGYIAVGADDDFAPTCITILPPNGCLYSGTISFINSTAARCNIITGLTQTAEVLGLSTTKTDYTFTNIPMLAVTHRRGSGYLQIYRFTLS